MYKLTIADIAKSTGLSVDVLSNCSLARLEELAKAVVASSQASFKLKQQIILTEAEGHSNMKK
jgi:hypothetical protein